MLASLTIDDLKSFTGLYNYRKKNYFYVTEYTLFALKQKQKQKQKQNFIYVFIEYLLVQVM